MANAPHRFKPAFFATLAAFGFFFGADVPIVDQLAIVEGVKNSAAIIFGVVAAWMALVYPDELKNLLKKQATGDGGTPRNSTRLFKAFYVASISLFLAIVFPAVIVLPSKIVQVHIIASHIGRLGLPIVLSAVSLQVWALCLVLLSTETLRIEARLFRRKVEGVGRLINRRRD